MNDNEQGLTLVDALVEIAKSDYPHEWARYCQLAPILEGKSGRSPEEDARTRLGRIGRYDSSLAWVSGGQELCEAQTIQEKLLDCFISAIRAGRCSLAGFNAALQPVSIPSDLIKAKAFRFNLSEMYVGDTRIVGVRVKLGLPAVQNEAPGRKPGQASPKDRASKAVLAILDNESERPRRGYGRMAALARMVQKTLPELPHKQNSIEKMIRMTVTEWENKNPDK